MNLEELKDQIIGAYEWDKEFGDEVRNVETYEELANVIKDRENFYPINADWIRECERPDLFFTGRENTGLFNSGDRNSGDLNSGYRNSGDLNSGDLNSGDLNSGYRNSGVFCNRKRNDKIFFFNKESSFTWEDWYRHKVYRIVQDSFVLTDWIYWDDMSDEEKENNPDAYVNYGYLRVYTYKEAWANLWSELTDDQKELFKTLPNFDADIFEDITGIEI